MNSVDTQIASQVANLERMTGRTLDEWIAVVRDSGIEKHAPAVAMLKTEHGLGHGYANLVVLRAREHAAGGARSADAIVEAQYSGRHAGLRPLYEAVVTAVRAFGADVELAPKKAYVSLRRSRQFAQVGPVAGTLEVGVNLPDHTPSERLRPMKGMASHRVRLSSLDEVDSELVGWLRAAYDRA